MGMQPPRRCPFGDFVWPDKAPRGFETESGGFIQLSADRLTEAKPPGGLALSWCSLDPLPGVLEELKFAVSREEEPAAR